MSITVTAESELERQQWLKAMNNATKMQVCRLLC